MGKPSFLGMLFLQPIPDTAEPCGWTYMIEVGYSNHPSREKQDPGALRTGPGRSQYPESIREVNSVQLGRV